MYKHFRKVVRDHNLKTGFDFKLPKDTDFSDEYAHPETEVDGFHLRGQIDSSNSSIYAIYAQNVNSKKGFTVDSIVSINQFRKIIKSDIFQYKLKNINLLIELAKRLNDQADKLSKNILDDALSDFDKEENYDLVVRAAKKLYEERR